MAFECDFDEGGLKKGLNALVHSSSSPIVLQFQSTIDSCLLHAIDRQTMTPPQAETPAFSMIAALDDLITTRHSVRQFLPTTVPLSILKECFALAQLTSSNSNQQPWRAVVVTNAALVSLKSRLAEAWDIKPPTFPAAPPGYEHYKQHLGNEYYGRLLGIGRDEVEKRIAASGRNMMFHHAPVGIIVYMDQRLSKHDMLGVVCWMQNLTLTLRARGVESIYLASVSGYPDLLKKELDIPAGSEILCGIAVGYRDDDYVGNTLKLGRDPWEEKVVFKS